MIKTNKHLIIFIAICSIITSIIYAENDDLIVNDDNKSATKPEKTTEKKEEKKITLPQKIHCGTIIKAKKFTNIDIVDMKKKKIENKLTAETIPNTEDVITKNSSSQKIFAVITIKITKNRSIGIYDFQLKVANETYQCLGISWKQLAFDPRHWQIIAQKEITVKLLFEIPENVDTCELISTLLTKVKEPNIKIPLTNNQQ